MPQPPTSPGRVTKDEARAARQAKARAARDASRRADRRRTLIVRSAAAVVVLALIAGVTAVILTAARPHVVALPTPPAATGATDPPWTIPADPAAGIAAAGLSISPMTSDGAHFHPHVDIRVNGRTVPVPADIGMNAASGAMSELHTHDSSGVVHIESGMKDRRYVLGQLFTEWGVRLDGAHLGALTSNGTRSLVAYVDGKPFAGNPAEIELLAHREVALIYGTAAQQKNPPSSYAFSAGD